MVRGHGVDVLPVRRANHVEYDIQLAGNNQREARKGGVKEGCFVVNAIETAVFIAP